MIMSVKREFVNYSNILKQSLKESYVYSLKIKGSKDMFVIYFGLVAFGTFCLHMLTFLGGYNVK